MCIRDRFNINDMEIIQGIMSACAELKAPVILQVSSSARKYAHPAYLVKMVEAAVKENPDIPVALHLDHGPSFETVSYTHLDVYKRQTQGCPHHCPGCHNPQTHDFEGGYLVDTDGLLEEMRQDPLLKGVTFSGGEPFCQPAPLAELARKIHESGLDVTVYTGYTYEQLLEQHNPDTDALLQQADVLIDGRYEQDKRDLTLRFRGRCV